MQQEKKWKIIFITRCVVECHLCYGVLQPDVSFWSEKSEHLEDM